MNDLKCPKCEKQFTRKKDYIYHTEKKKKPCVVINNDNDDNDNDNNNDNNDNDDNNDNNQQEVQPEKKIIFECKYCLKKYSKMKHLLRHELKLCSFKKELEEHNNNNNNNNGDDKYEKIIAEYKKMSEKMSEEIKAIKDENKKLNLKLSKLKPQKLINNETNNINNGVINNIICNNNNFTTQYGKENLNNIDNEHYLRLIQSSSTGSQLITDLIRMIHFNEDYPEYHNICMTDQNREKILYYNGTKWCIVKKDNYIIPDLIEKAIKFSNIKNKEFTELGKNNQRIKHRVEIINKYTTRCDSDHLEDLKDEETENASEINRCNDFIILVSDRINELIYNEKDMVIQNKNNMNKIKNLL